jgi:two-component system KDP operon response regulator KdpE
MQPARILIINDEPAIRAFFRFNLEIRGYRVLESGGCPEVLEVFRREKPDLTILDLRIAGTDGLELCRCLCEEEDSSVIVFNMRGGESDLLKCLKMGVGDYLCKPFGVDEFIARVRAVLRYKLKAAARNTSKSLSKA